MKADELMVGDIVLRKGKPVEIVSTSGIEAERVTGTNRYQIRMCCNGKYKTAGGYRWKFKEQ